MPNQPAFPIHDPFAVECPNNVQEALLLRNGMDLRDYFAKGVMQAEFSAQSECNGVGVIPVGISDENLISMCKHFYRVADAMMIARKG